MIIRGSEISHRVKYWVRPDIINRIAEGSIKAYFNSSLEEITPTTVVIRTPEGQISIQNDFVLAMTGYLPNFGFLRNIGVECSLDELQLPTHSEETMETNVPNVYLAGVVCGGMNTHSYFIENSRVHAEKIVKHISSSMI
jgi:thioredoxin reductase (NADPH)